ncbi:molybdopterin molybdenumtransferase [Sinorhizobium sp. KGO-5]|uniref:molybdopterin molybdotransferase MoeA n=1 Tax=Sinorhizobium sp. KGO-5 TaxID=1470810 RepID=UPI0029492522|nr:molybdopterin molybdenumtransferase [Sinorhizobium sp. KGO-5]
MNIDLQRWGSPAADCGATAHQMSVEEAVRTVVGAAIPVTESESVDLLSASGRILARPVFAGYDLPRFDHSAMDGYAVRCADFTGAGPWTLSVVRSLVAGDNTMGVAAKPGTAMAIYTGASVPSGYDAVVIAERCLRSGNSVVTSYRPRAGENIRVAGEDLAAGSRAVDCGAMISTHVAAMLAALGMARVDVLRRIRVALVTNGTELRQLGEPLDNGQIYDSNRYLARSMLSLPWIEVSDAGTVRDRLDELSAALFELSLTHDVVVSTGGMSHGGADFVRAALVACGASLGVLKVAMRPGKPVTIGRLGAAMFIGLPGNPMAAAIALRQIAMPAIRATSGLDWFEPLWFPATSGFTYCKRQGRTEFVPVSVVGRDDHDIPVLNILGRGSSGSLSPLARADGIAVLPSEVSEVRQGMRLRYEPF